MATDIVAHARDWIGTPYVHQASVKGAGCDCLGLLVGVWRDIHGEAPEDIPPYLADWDAPGGESLRDGLARHLTPIGLDIIAPGDVVLFRMVARASARHCAIVGKRDGVLTLIHARQNKRVGEEPLSPFWRRKLAYAFRI
jgi:NlpC/P60 family putative phage cell wall peptidase